MKNYTGLSLAVNKLKNIFKKIFIDLKTVAFDHDEQLLSVLHYLQMGLYHFDKAFTERTMQDYMDVI